MMSLLLTRLPSNYLVTKLVREKCTVALGGDGEMNFLEDMIITVGFYF